jgi:xanthine dehydrogenase FAD-binding subunit
LKDFEYAAATTVDEAVSLMSAGGDRAKVLIGGTDLIVQLREGLRQANVVVDVKRIPELMELDYQATGGLRLGAAVPCVRIYGDKAIKQAYPALADAAHIIGGWQIQSRASIGGNLCNASPAADSIPALIAHDTTCQIAGPSGRRSVPVSEFCVSPGRNCLARGEILTSIDFPAEAPRSSSAYLRFIPRNEMDIAVVGVGSSLQLSADGQTIARARVALGAVAPTPVFAAAASDWLAGKPVSEATFQEAGELAKQAAKPISDRRGTAEYRTHLVGVLVKRTLAIAAERARATVTK